jgi:type 1 fimbriae regulatory protein FimB
LSCTPSRYWAGCITSIHSWRRSPDAIFAEDSAPMAPTAAQKVVETAGKRAGIPFSVHIHMLRHSCGYSLINRGVDLRTVQSYLGHASISSTAVYTHLNATRFDGLWQD